MKKITVKSYAKINLSIDVGKAQPNGFHDVDMIMQQLAFHDDVEISFEANADSPNQDNSGIESDRGKPWKKFQIKLTTNRVYLPTDERNLAYRAAELMINRFGEKKNGGKIIISIFKRIPVGAGMAGGSGNGAAVVHGINALWKLKLSLAQICDICEELGSDVPFCALGQAKMNKKLPAPVGNDKMAASCVRARGRGTEMKKLRGISKAVVIAKPNFSVSTAEVYANIDDAVVDRRPNNDRLETMLNEKSSDIYEEFINVLENYTLKAYPAVGVLKSKMEKYNPRVCLMSGSGPTVFAVFDDMNDAMMLSDALRKEGYESYWTYTAR